MPAYPAPEESTMIERARTDITNTRPVRLLATLRLN
jgi:hypothetical protein